MNASGEPPIDSVHSSPAERLHSFDYEGWGDLIAICLSETAGGTPISVEIDAGQKILSIGNS